MTLDKDAPTSPLRFPGSKSKVMKKLMPYLNIPHTEYREPFLGGGSIFLTKTLAKNNWLNDKDENLAALWKIIKKRPKELCELIKSTTPSIVKWHEIKNKPATNLLDKAFKYLFLNRTNYSGIITANPLGGLDQESKYKIDCRWNPDTLIKRINKCSNKLKNTKITSLDFTKVIKEDGDDVFMVVDPPYYQKGKKLYPVYMTPSEHEKLANLLKNTKHKFLLTIDECSEIRQLYNWANFTCNKQWYYTINQGNKDSCKKGDELFITNFDINLNSNNTLECNFN